MRKAFPVGSDVISNSYINTSTFQGKNSFEAIESPRNHNFFLSDICINKVPSSSTLSQRIGASCKLF